MENKIHVLCISGKAESGKDTLAQYIQTILYDVCSEQCQIMHYADLLKYICTEYFSWSGRKDDVGRRLLQHIGTDVFRSINKEYWVNTFIPIIKAINMELGIRFFVIPDCRFENEVSRLREDDQFKVWHVQMLRDDAQKSMSNDTKSHISERGMGSESPDYYIDNNGTRHELLASAMNIASIFCGSVWDSEYEERIREVRGCSESKREMVK